MKYSVTTAGILVSVVGTALVSAGFSEQCSSEVIALAPALIGGIIAWIGRYRKGGIDAFGFKK